MKSQIKKYKNIKIVITSVSNDYFYRLFEKKQALKTSNIFADEKTCLFHAKNFIDDYIDNPDKYLSPIEKRKKILQIK